MASKPLPYEQWMKPELYVFNTPSAFGETVADRFMEASIRAIKQKDIMTVALSGEARLDSYFEALAREPRRNMIPWQYMHLFWGNERCVPPDHPESNFKMADDVLLKEISIPDENIHRIKGEANPEEEARRYAEEIWSIVPRDPTGIPRFDWIFLGLGSEGYTASLFPGSSALEENESICTTAKHPMTGQNRITSTLFVINSVARLSFLDSGVEKSGIVAKVLGYHGDDLLLPASRVSLVDGLLEWYVDIPAASLKGLNAFRLNVLLSSGAFLYEKNPVLILRVERLFEFSRRRIFCCGKDMIIDSIVMR